MQLAVVIIVAIETAIFQHSAWKQFTRWFALFRIGHPSDKAFSSRCFRIINVQARFAIKPIGTMYVYIRCITYADLIEKLRGNQFAMSRIPRQTYVTSKLSPIADLGIDIINDERFKEFILCMIMCVTNMSFIIQSKINIFVIIKLFYFSIIF